ncbi:MAG TPA: rRNA pseudouridine synthase [Leptolyngbyaceae cyanobacterium M33_DOE_097]|uniref:Pseudouridine synthase n=1 Tax=Oscillatoriales cyanobacterium SpSt-418 TaxID=2282169 RepID=A0A7C3PDG0_9CYAN|nr:rRNA pseudouridine synthase [Leptolyngbyaceae cyanobacterium M33_DOE_097]
MPERLQKVLSQWGVASRRQAEQMIVDGRVKLNGAIAQLGQTVDVTCDRVEVDQQIVNPDDRPAPIYLLLNKPIGYLSTCYDPQNRRTVLDLLPESWQSGQGIHPVGRLDSDSSGALLLTNDGELTFLLTHPRHHVPKTYRVWVAGVPSRAVIRQWQVGVMLDGHPTLPAQVKIIKQEGDRRTLLEVTLQEGRNRQIRRVAELLGHPVLKLHRIAIGPIRLASAGQPPLARGNYRALHPTEICSLKKLTYQQRDTKGHEEIVDE